MGCGGVVMECARCGGSGRLGGEAGQTASQGMATGQGSEMWSGRWAVRGLRWAPGA